MVNKGTKFVIITLPRSGSTVLVKTLDHHPEIYCAGELFYFSGNIYHTENQFPFWKIKNLGNKINYVINFPNVWFRLKRFMNAFYLNQDPKFIAVGYKMMYQHILYMPGIMTYLKKNHVKVILLTRNDLLRNALSDMRARESGIYHREPGGQHNPDKKLHVNLELLSEKMKETKRWADKLHQVVKGMDILEIDYADFGDWTAMTGKIFNFLGVSNINLRPASERLNPLMLDDMIENAEEVKKWAIKNGYSK
ncbi:MAG: sulfotransferase [Bacteroidetes bacterium]|nr:sulfotransferase [Bacteroidota bacterium]